MRPEPSSRGSRGVVAGQLPDDMSPRSPSQQYFGPSPKKATTDVLKSAAEEGVRALFTGSPTGHATAAVGQRATLISVGKTETVRLRLLH